MILSRNFTLSELTVSQTAARKGINNDPPGEAITELRRLCDTVLQPLRDALGSPIVVSSGYRSPLLNRAVGGARESCHVHGRAADIMAPGVPVLQLCKRIVDLGLPYRQLIDEFGAWVHVSIEPVGTTASRQTLTARRGRNGRTIYTAGLIQEP